MRRTAYRAPGQRNLCPADGHLNLPAERHSHGLRRWAAVESARGSSRVPARRSAGPPASGWAAQARQLAEARRRPTFDASTSAVERPVLARSRATSSPRRQGGGDASRGAARGEPEAGAERGSGKLQNPPSKGEIARSQADRDGRRRLRRRHRPGARSADLLPRADAEHEVPRAGRRQQGQVADREPRRGRRRCGRRALRGWPPPRPGHRATGAPSTAPTTELELHRVPRRPRGAGSSSPILCDFVHVTEYLWGAAWSFHREGDPATEAWVRRHAEAVLCGGRGRSAANIRREASRGGLSAPQRKGGDAAPVI